MLRRIMFAVFAAGAGVSALVHVASFFGIAPAVWPWLGALRLGALVAIFSGVFAGSLRVGEPSPEAKRLVGRLRLVPLAIGCAGLGIYAAVNYFVCSAQLEGGAPDERAGAYYLTNDDGTLIRTLSPSEYQSCLAYQARMATGPAMWMFFLSATLWLAPLAAVRSPAPKT
jgi:hypothetical protein